MNAKGILAASLFVISTVGSNAWVATPPSSFDFIATPPVAGLPMVVTVLAAPCPTVTIILKVAGEEITSTVSPPGIATLNVPAGCSGRPYTLELKCPSERTSTSATVG